MAQDGVRGRHATYAHRCGRVAGGALTARKERVPQSRATASAGASAGRVVRTHRETSSSGHVVAGTVLNGPRRSRWVDAITVHHPAGQPFRRQGRLSDDGTGVMVVHDVE